MRSTGSGGGGVRRFIIRWSINKRPLSQSVILMAVQALLSIKVIKLDISALDDLETPVGSDRNSNAF